MNDSEFVGALDLFIKEEQQHSRYLAAFMESEGIPLVPRHWVDSTFRQLRGLAGFELSFTVLVTAEIIAVPYYRALRAATSSSDFKMICTRILDDEASHLKYQASMLARVAGTRGRARQRVVTELHRLLLIGTMLVVWKTHRAVFGASSDATSRDSRGKRCLNFPIGAWRAGLGRRASSGRRSMALSKVGQTERRI